MSHPLSTWDKADEHDSEYTEGGMYKPPKNMQDKHLKAKHRPHSLMGELKGRTKHVEEMMNSKLSNKEWFAKYGKKEARKNSLKKALNKYKHNPNPTDFNEKD